MIKNRICYIGFLLGTIWIYIAYIDYTALLLITIMIAFPIVLLIISYIATRKITIDIENQNSNITKGKKGNMSIKVYNPSLLPFINAKIWIVIENKYNNVKCENVMKINIPDKEISRYTLEFTPNYCGKIEVKIKKFKIYDYTGLWSFKGKIKSSSFIYVIPEVNTVQIKINERLNEYIEDPIRYSDSIPGDDGSQVFDIREYMQGDKLQKIHWKLTAKRDEMFMKEFSMPIDASAIIFAELSMKERIDSIAYADAVIETVFVVATTLLEQNIFFCISWYDNENDIVIKKEITSEEDVMNSIYGIMEVDMYSGQGGLERYENIYGNTSEAAFLYVTDNIDILPSYTAKRVLVVGENFGISNMNKDIVNIKIDNIYESIECIGEF